MKKKSNHKRRSHLLHRLPSRNIKRGKPPGSLDVRPKEDLITGSSFLEVFTLRQDLLEEKKTDQVQDLPHIVANSDMCWINVDSHLESTMLSELGRIFNISNLSLEDIITTDQRPKVEFYSDHILVIVRMFKIDQQTRVIGSEQISFILGKNFLLTFQEGLAGDVFQGVRERLRKSKNKTHRWHADNVLHALLDSVVDQYFYVLEAVNEEVYGLESRLLDDDDQGITKKIYEKKIEVLFMRRFIWPVRDCVSQLIKHDGTFIGHGLRPYLRDLQDHVVQVIEGLDIFNDALSLMIDMSLAVSNKKINEIMKVLTMFASIFIPLTFIVGVYGMNFRYMPELEWRYGYFALWAFMIVLSVTIFLFFKRRKWL